MIRGTAYALATLMPAILTAASVLVIGNGRLAAGFPYGSLVLGGLLLTCVVTGAATKLIGRSWSDVVFSVMVAPVAFFGVLVGALCLALAVNPPPAVSVLAR